MMKKTLCTLPGKMHEREPLSDSFFIDRGVVKIFGEINDAMQDRAISLLLYWDHIYKEQGIPRAEREVNVWINSPGGSVSAGLAIYDTMNYIDCDIRTTCVGLAASMGAFLLSAGTHGKREALPHSAVLIHQPLGGTQGQATDILLYAEQMRLTRECLNELLAAHTAKPIEQIRADTERDYRMTAEEAKNYGLIDRVIRTPIKAMRPAGKEIVL